MRKLDLRRKNFFSRFLHDRVERVISFRLIYMTYFVLLFWEYYRHNIQKFRHDKIRNNQLKFISNCSPQSRVIYRIT